MRIERAARGGVALDCSGAAVESTPQTENLVNTKSCWRIAALVVFYSGAAPGAPQSVRVYDSTEIALDSYTIVKRLGVSEWRSAFRIAGYTDEGQARDALLTRAAQLGADGVVNLHCLGQTDRVFNPAGYYCYGSAIRLKSATR